MPSAFTLIALLYLPWAPHLLRQREQVSRSFYTRPFAWDELAKACYQTLAVRWEDGPPSAAVAWGATAACLLPAAAMLGWGRRGLRLVGLCVLATFDGAICTSIADRNVVQSRYFVFANVLLLCGLPALVGQMAAARNSIVSRKRQRGTSWPAPRLRVGLPGGAALVALVVGMAWLCLAHAERREGFVRRPGMMAAMAYLAEVRQPGEPVLVCNPLLQITAEAHAGDGVTDGATNRPHPSPLPEVEGEKAVENVASTGRARKPILPVQVLSRSRDFPQFQGTAVMREEDYLLPEALAEANVRRVWAIDAVDWIVPEWKLQLPRQWVDVAEVTFPEWGADNCQIVVRRFERRRKGESEE